MLSTYLGYLSVTVSIFSTPMKEQGRWPSTTAKVLKSLIYVPIVLQIARSSSGQLHFGGRSSVLGEDAFDEEICWCGNRYVGGCLTWSSPLSIIGTLLMKTCMSGCVLIQHHMQKS
jgi:hypothetical protein